jgi:hypothetical protein
VTAQIVATKIDDLTQGDDNTDLDSSALRHGLLPKLDNDPLHFLDGQGGWSEPGPGSTANLWQFPAGVAVEPLGPSGESPRFGSDSPYLSFVLGSQTDSDYGPGNGGIYAGARAGTSGQPPVNEPYVAVSVWDFDSPYVGADSGRTVFYGGGGWGAPDANNHQFYTAAAYTETNDTGVLALHVGTDATGVLVRLWGRALAAAAFALEGDITPSELAAGTTQNYAPTSLSTASTLRQAVNAAGSVLGGLTGGYDGRILVVHNISTGAAETLTLNHEDASSTAANRFVLPTGVALIIVDRGTVTLRYDSTSSRWRLVGKSF